MSIICSKCGGTNIMCEAMIEPNTKKFSHYTDESFLYAWCDDCHKGVILTDVNKVRNYITTEYRIFKESYGVEPQYANCRITWKDTQESCDVRIMLSVDTGIEDDEIFYSCSSLNELLSLTEHSLEDFIVTECHGFAVLTETEVLERQLFNHEVNGKSISVTGKEVIGYYGEHYNLKKEEMERYAARYTCVAKYYKESNAPLLDHFLVKHLLDEEKQMKKGETAYFKLQLTFLWYIKIEKEDDPLISPFRYILNACCLDNIQTFDRKYMSLEDTLLHCLNGFNENERTPDRYKSLDVYLAVKNTGKEIPNGG